MATPTEPAAGYLSPGLQDELQRFCVGTADVWVDFLIPDSIIGGKTYRIEFGDTTYFHNRGRPYYIIYEVSGAQKIAKTDTTWIDGFSQSPLVDGFVVNVTNEECELNFEKTGWIVGQTTYRWRVNLDSRFTPPDPNSRYNLNINYPADFEILFSDQIIDTASNPLGYPLAYPAKFSVFNLTENKPANFQFQEFGIKDSTLSPLLPGGNIATLEGMMIWVNDPNYTTYPEYLKTSWRFFFEADTNLPNRDPRLREISFIS